MTGDAKIGDRFKSVADFFALHLQLTAQRGERCPISTDVNRQVYRTHGKQQRCVQCVRHRPRARSMFTVR
ncbi:hypothetical protein PSP6_130090 [Paraburkholderia tropica]|nr:hypothetical protein PSP6_130090 [Paraburkholderia tropica]